MKWRSLKTVMPNLNKTNNGLAYKSVPLVLRVWLSNERYHIFQGCVVEFNDDSLKLELWVRESGKSDHKPIIYNAYDSFYKVEWLDEYNEEKPVEDALITIWESTKLPKWLQKEIAPVVNEIRENRSK